MVMVVIPPNQDWRRDQARDLLEAIDRLDVRKTQWEEDFLSSMEEILEGTRSYSDKQLEKLNEVYRRLSNA